MKVQDAVSGCTFNNSHRRSMNAGRRICCNAANAFRPGPALRNVFYDVTHQRYASQTSEKQRHRLAESVRYQDVFEQGRRPDQGSGLRRSKRREASDVASKHVATGQHREATTDAQEDLSKVLENNEDFEGEELLDINTASDFMDDLYLSNAADEEAASAKAIPKEQPPTPAKSSHLRETTNAPKSAQSSLEYQSPKLAEIAAKKVANKAKDVLEYEGQYVQPVTSAWKWAERLPWVSKLNCNDKKIAATKR